MEQIKGGMHGNNSSHFLANLAREKAHTAVWLASRPQGLASICDKDCNS
jgi:hypothetical protein